ncbi:unnamed protein product [Acanthosepion pharaonis]|uniref:Uncharacterized protein n=1 Tax=Acanthosepion pharaonis TaxID=158019 RepID=A0A812EN45_ACAPH|nr:unnamed protein product [Sepia pharaonis]
MPPLPRLRQGSTSFVATDTGKHGWRRSSSPPPSHRRVRPSNAVVMLLVETPGRRMSPAVVTAVTFAGSCHTFGLLLTGLFSTQFLDVQSPSRRSRIELPPSACSFRVSWLLSYASGKQIDGPRTWVAGHLAKLCPTKKPASKENQAPVPTPVVPAEEGKNYFLYLFFPPVFHIDPFFFLCASLFAIFFFAFFLPAFILNYLFFSFFFFLKSTAWGFNFIFVPFFIYFTLSFYFRRSLVSMFYFNFLLPFFFCFFHSFYFSFFFFLSSFLLFQLYMIIVSNQFTLVIILFSIYFFLYFFFLLMNSTSAVCISFSSFSTLLILSSSDLLFLHHFISSFVFFLNDIICFYFSYYNLLNIYKIIFLMFIICLFLSFSLSHQIFFI